MRWRLTETVFAHIVVVSSVLLLATGCSSSKASTSERSEVGMRFVRAMLVTHDLPNALGVVEARLQDDLADDIRKNQAIGMRLSSTPVWSDDCSALKVGLASLGGELGGCVEAKVLSCPYSTSANGPGSLDVLGGSIQAFVNDAVPPRVTSYSIGGHGTSASPGDKPYASFVSRRTRCLANGRSTR